MSKYCKECGKELPQNSKNDLCEYHQNKRNGKIRKFGEVMLGLVGTVVSVGVLVISKGKLGGPKA